MALHGLRASRRRGGGRDRLLPVLVLALVAQGVGVPLCPQVALSRPKCSLEAPTDHPWSTSYIYHSAKTFASRSSKKQLFEELPHEPCETSIALENSGPAKDFPSSNFLRAGPSTASLFGQTSSSWANTPEGEWTVLVDESQPLEARLKLDDGGSCPLHSVSVYRPLVDRLSLRLNFAGCPEGSEVHHAGLEIDVQRSWGEGGGSNLVAWMCSLVDPQACPADYLKVPTPAPAAAKDTEPTPAPTIRERPVLSTSWSREGARRLAALNVSFTAVGLGHCVNKGRHRPEQRAAASTVERCAQACAVKSQNRSLDDAAWCRGFAFSEQHPHCILYGDFAPPSNAQQLYASGDWGCYKVGGAAGRSEDTRAPAHREATPAPPFLAPVRVAMQGSVPPDVPNALDLRGELGDSSHPAVRRRLAPLKQGCYKPFDWIVLDPKPESQVTLNAEHWDFIKRNLPIVSAPTLEMESALAADRVCVSVGDSAAPGAMAEAESTQPAGASKEKAKCVPMPQMLPGGPPPQPWKLIVAGLLAAIFAALVTVVVMDERVRNFLTPSEKLRTRVVEGVAGVGARVHSFCERVPWPSVEDILHADEKIPCMRRAQAPGHREADPSADQPLLEMAGAQADKPGPDEKKLQELRDRLNAAQQQRGPAKPAFNAALNTAFSAALAPPPPTDDGADAGGATGGSDSQRSGATETGRRRSPIQSGSQGSMPSPPPKGKAPGSAG